MEGGGGVGRKGGGGGGGWGGVEKGRGGERGGVGVKKQGVGNHTGAGGVCPLKLFPPPLLQEYGFCGRSNCSKSHVIVAIQQKELQKSNRKRR